MAAQSSSEKLIGVILVACILVSLAVANSAASDFFFMIMHADIPIGIGDLKLEKTLEHWINDGLMSIFFLLAGLEIKREILKGELSGFRKAALPVIAAIGGMLIPALIFSSFNWGKATSHGWAIPMATDIAFAIGIMALVGKAAPQPLKIFLIALAIVDDIGAILVIAIFYSSTIDYQYLLYAILLLGVLLAANRYGIGHLWFYLIPGILLWFFVYKSGIHSTISGVLLAMTIPLETKSGKRPLVILEHHLLQPVYFVVLPLFVLVNTAIVLKADAISQVISPVGFGILFGLIIGKPMGVLLFSWAGVKARLAQLPGSVSIMQLTGAGFLAGIGFTMSIFIALLSFEDKLQHDVSKMAILMASALAAITGFLILKIYSDKSKLVNDL